MIKPSIIIFLSLLPIIGSAQQYWSYVERNDTLAERGNFITHNNGSLYVQGGRRCLPDFQSCGSIRIIDTLGNLLTTTVLDQIKISNDNGIQFTDSSIYFSGYRNLASNPEGLYHYELNHEGEIVDFRIQPIDNEPISHGSHIVNNSLYNYGTVFVGQSGNQNLVDIVISSYDLTTGERNLQQYNRGYTFIDIWDMKSFGDDEVVFFTTARGDGFPNGQRDIAIEKMDAEGNIDYLYLETVPDLNAVVVPNMTVLKDEKIVFQVNNENGGGTGVNWRYVDKNGNYLYDEFLLYQIVPDIIDTYDITPTQDGGFIATGFYADRSDIPDDGIEFNGMLCKMSGDGELLWIRQYRNVHGDTGEYMRSSLSSAIELPNGDIVATGVARNETTDLWVLKVDSNGCFGEEDCGEITVHTENLSTEIYNDIKVNVYPNPAVGRVSISSEVSIAKIMIYDAQGSFVEESAMLDIDVSSYPDGIYFLHIIAIDGSDTVKKVVVRKR